MPERSLVEGLDPYADRPHECHHEEAEEYYVGRSEGEEPTGTCRDPLHDEDERHRHHDGERDAQQVVERREPHHAVVGMEKPEPDHEAEQEKPEGPDQRHEHLRGLFGAMMHGISQQTGEKHEGGVEQQYAPVGQRPPGEIPF